jgi:hypothetical protein
LEPSDLPPIEKVGILEQQHHPAKLVSPSPTGPAHSPIQRNQRFREKCLTTGGANVIRLTLISGWDIFLEIVGPFLERIRHVSANSNTIGNRPPCRQGLFNAVVVALDSKST